MTIAGETFATFKTEDQPVTNSAVLVDAVDMLLTIPANARIKFKMFVPFSLAGAAGGYKFQTVLSAGAAALVWHYEIFQGAAAVLVNSQVQVASAAISGALAVAATHVMHCEGFIDNRAAAADITMKLQFAQNVADAAAITLLKGSVISFFYI